MNEDFYVNKEDFDKINQAKNIYLPGNFISTELIKRILEEDDYFLYTVRFFKDNIKKFRILLQEKDMKREIILSKIEILRAMEIYVKENNLDRTRFDELKNLISYDKLKEKYYEKKFERDIENSHYIINIQDFLDFLDNPRYDFEKRCEESVKICNIDKEIFAYALLTFFNEEHLRDNYLLPNNIEANIKTLEREIDTSFVNKLLICEDTLYQKVELDEKLEEVILKNIPDNLSLLEKSIYIYIMLCKVLTYDEEFYALNEEDIVNVKHEDYHRVNKINSSNNRVTCYEFNLIYAKFLSKLGINFKSNYVGYDDEAYGKGHVYLVYRVGKYLVHADSTEQILHGDIANAKRNDMITGIELINKNNSSKQEFHSALEKVYTIIAEREEKKLYQKDNFDDLVREYHEKTNNYEQVDLKIKLSILLNKLNTSNYVGVDLMSYLLCLKKVLFTYEEMRYNLKTNIVANKDTKNDDLAKLSCIISINDEYYLFTPHEKTRILSFVELKALFDNEMLSYLENDTSLIDGIRRGK